MVVVAVVDFDVVIVLVVDVCLLSDVAPRSVLSLAGVVWLYLTLLGFV